MNNTVFNNIERSINKNQLKAVTTISECQLSLDELIANGKLHTWHSRQLNLNFLGLSPFSRRQRESIVMAYSEADRRLEAIRKVKPKKVRVKPLPNLTAKETVTFKYLQANNGFNKGHKQLAKRLEISEKTARNHLNKLECNNYIFIIRDESNSYTKASSIWVNTDFEFQHKEELLTDFELSELPY
ncbi:hypothetical protein [uncultured Endozoicomonas sp.]|uniref:hypothetical protein n=1 Tax=uncultured Endozoicomonas sp. TaxID=432652 RepID=UPI00260B1E95|nr:hypothetical protein [uncultured Endozoicomonas sp.]